LPGAAAGTVLLTDKSGKTTSLVTTTASGSTSGEVVTYKVGDVSYSLNTKTGQVSTSSRNADGAAAGRPCPGAALLLGAGLMMVLALM
jgi:hypothetical protein